MSFRRLGACAAMVLAVLLTGCATPKQGPINLPDGYLATAQARAGRVGVVLAELPKPDTQFPGADCLLCLALANGVHSSLTKEVQGFSTAELKPLPEQLVQLLRKRGVDAVLLSDPLKLADVPDLAGGAQENKSRKDYRALKERHRLDRLLVVEVTSLGVWRSYSSYVPAGAPRAVLNGSASLIDLNTHALEWHVPLAVSRAADGNWDEPGFPGLTNAYYQVLETGMDLVKKPWAP